MAVSVVSEHRAGSAVATVAAGSTVAALLGVLLGHAAGRRAPFAVVTVPASAAVALLALVLPERGPPACATSYAR